MDTRDETEHAETKEDRTASDEMWERIARRLEVRAAAMPEGRGRWHLVVAEACRAVPRLPEGD